MNPFLEITARVAHGPGSFEMALPLIKALGIRPGMRVLEVGAGSGQIATVLAREWNVVVFTLEPWGYPDQIQEVAQAAGVWDRVVPLKLEVQSLPFANDSFDAIFSIGSFEMIGDDRQAALAQMIRVAKPGASIGIAEPMCLPTQIPKKVAELDKAHNLRFQHFFRTVQWNCDLFLENGLEISRKSYFPEAMAWWREYIKEGAERQLVEEDGGRWLSLGMVVGRKAQKG
ncbi:MAG: methyltransferase domain-containing protein [Candidatus Latescibacteria bacterium]|nr:methyltransferase domain-containing protein [Candidatus Latescibacterota bacterium]